MLDRVEGHAPEHACGVVAAALGHPGMGRLVKGDRDNDRQEPDRENLADDRKIP